MATRLGVDVGGTFSDLVTYDDRTGEVLVGKHPTTADAPERGIAAVVSSTLPHELIGAADFFLHGSTVALNALLERNGAVVGLLTTAGFRDVLEIRRGDRESIYDPRWKAPAPLVPRPLRLPVRERVYSNGEILTALVEQDVLEALERFRAFDVRCIAVAFLHSYANPRHELLAERLLRERGFEGDISLSHRISGEFREYERTATTVIDAYVRPNMSRYLERLGRSLAELGFEGQTLMTRSGGGSVTFAEAQRRPFETIMSGPVAGAVGAGEVCARLGIRLGVTADVGGTSFDTALVVDGRPQLKHEGSISGLPVQAQWIDVRSIGAGGGSIAYVDTGGLLRVGPESAGSNPGPACYGLGGHNATVTDAGAYLGMLADGQLAAGLALDLAAAGLVLRPLAQRLSLSLDETAHGVLTIAAAHMTDLIRTVALERGEDVREATVVAFGGAGPFFATILARELGVNRIVVPKYAGNFSAWSLLGQDITRSAAATLVCPLTDEHLDIANKTLGRLRGRLQSDIPASVEVSYQPAVDLRYMGQEHALTIPVETSAAPVLGAAATLEVSFHDEYERAFGHRLDAPLELVAIRLTAVTPLPARSMMQAKAPGLSDHDSPKTIEAFSFTREARIPFRVIDRDVLGVDDRFDGPAIIKEETSTTYVDAGFSVSVEPTGSMLISGEGRQ